jgi:acyl carrier protein
MDVERTIKEMIFDKFKIEATNKTDLAEIVQDSFAKVELLFEIEEALGIKISEEDIMEITTIDDLVSKAKKYV